MKSKEKFYSNQENKEFDQNFQYTIKKNKNKSIIKNPILNIKIDKENIISESKDILKTKKLFRNLDQPPKQFEKSAS